MEPEIARRCLSCGASVRGRASFCPQCGSRLGEGAAAENSRAVVERSQDEAAAGNQTRAPTGAATQGTLVDEAARVAATLNDKLPTLSPEARISGNHRSAPEAAHEPQPHAENKAANDAHALPSQADTRGGMRQRAASVGASVGGNLRPRVEKLREASTVVFDEASDDPGLRFVIIAALLFLLFLFILLFSYILG